MNVETVTSTTKLGAQIYLAALQEARAKRVPCLAKDIAANMANKFYSELLHAIDQEAFFQEARSIDGAVVTTERDQK